MGRYGTLGLDVGTFGRWSRLGWGALILAGYLGSAAGVVSDSDSASAFLVEAALYFLAIAAAYVVVYWALGKTFLARTNAWVATAIFVGPALLLAWWNLTIEPMTNVALPGAMIIAMGVFIGASFILQWRLGYGGCEVVSLPVLLTKRRYATYCIPLVALDYVEKKITDGAVAER